MMRAIARLVVATTTAILCCGAASAQGPYLYELLDQPAYRAAFDSMLKFERDLPAWLKEFRRSMNGVTAPSEEVWIGGDEFRYAWVCEPHNCGGNELHILFAPEAKRAWGLLIQGGEERTWFGNPDEYVQIAIRQHVSP